MQASGSAAQAGAVASRGRRGRGLRLLLVCLVFGIGFLLGVAIAFGRPTATRAGFRPIGIASHHHEEGAAVTSVHRHREGRRHHAELSDSLKQRHAAEAEGAAQHHHDDDDAAHLAKNSKPADEHHHHEEHLNDGGAAGDGADVGNEQHSDHDDHHDDHDHGDDEAAPADDPQKEALLKQLPPDSIEATAVRRSINNTIFVIPVNDGYVDFGLNLICSMERLGLFRALHRGGAPLSHAKRTKGAGYVFVAMDELAYKKLQAMKLPVVKDPDVPFVSSKSAAWGDPKFHKLVCTKLIPVLRFLRAGLNVILSDADIVFRHDPFPFVRHDLGLTFTIGSCHKDLPDNVDLSSGDGLAKLNTGFYHAKTSPGVISLLSRALENCRVSHLTGDQPAINTVLHDDLGKHRRDMPYQYGFFDGCLFANGCIYFKHLCANTTMPDPRPAILAGNGAQAGGKKVKATKLKGPDDAVPAGHIRRDDPVLVHANFLVGKKDKIKHLQKYGLWYDECIASWRSTIPADLATATGAPSSSGGGD